jgi:hypothetical protein
VDAIIRPAVLAMSERFMLCVVLHYAKSVMTDVAACSIAKFRIHHACLNQQAHLQLVHKHHIIARYAYCVRAHKH